MKNPNVIVSSDFGPIIINANDTVIGRNIIEKGYWSKNDIEFIAALMKKQVEKKGNIVFFDIGANIGTHSLAIAKMFGYQVKIHAFEAQRQIYYMLCGTMAINGVSNIYCYNNAVSDISDSVMSIDLLDYNSANNFGALELIKPRASDQDAVIKVTSEIVKTISLDSLNCEFDFLKIDVEGMEDKVLRGGIASINKNRPIVFVEIHKTDAEYVVNFFNEIGDYSAFLVGIDLICIPMEYQITINDSKRVL